MEPARGAARLIRSNGLNDPISGHMPCEIVSMIFEMYANHTCPDVREPYVSPKNSPIRLGGVCKAWRKIAWSTPRLWNFVPINLDNRLFVSEVPHAYPLGCQMLEEWLKRSGRLPLHIRVSKRITSRPSDECVDARRHYSRVMNVLNTYSSRWRDVDLSVPTYLLAQVKQGPVDQSPPILERLRLCATDDPRSRHYTIRIKDLSPKEIHINKIPLEFLSVKWTDLTTLDARQIYTDEALLIIANAPRLSSCRLSGLRNRNHTLPADRLVHPLLSHLSLRCSMTDDALLSHLKLPGLTSLFLNSSPIDNFFSIPRIIEFIQVSSPRVLSALLVLRTAPLDDIIELLCQLPFLTSLTFNRPFESGLWTRLFKSIGQPSSTSSSQAPGDIFLPDLQELKFIHPYDHGPCRKDWDLILDTLKAALDSESKSHKNVRLLTIAYHITDPHNEQPRHVKLKVKHIVDLADSVMRDPTGFQFHVEALRSRPELKKTSMDIISVREMVEKERKDRDVRVRLYY